MKNKVRRKNIVILVLLIFCLTACGADTWDEHYELGMKYLSDGNYEEAIIEFTAAIEIDEMRPEAYIGAADGYVGMEEYQKAIDILTTGYEKCNDEEIYDKLQQLKEKTFSEWGVDDLMTLDDVTLNGTPLDNMSWDTALKNVKSIYSTHGGEYHTDITSEGKNGFGYAPEVGISISEGGGYPGLFVSFTRNSDETYLGWNDIALGDDMESALNKIGFTQEGIDYLTYLLNNQKEIDLLPGNDGKGKCIRIYTSMSYLNGQEIPRLRMIFMSNSSENTGHWIEFCFEDGILTSAEFMQNDIQIGD